MRLLEPCIQVYLRLKHRLQGVSDVSPRQAARLIGDGAVVLDVRDHAELDWARFSGSLHIPLAELEYRLGELSAYRDRQLLVVCHGGLRSGKACRLLAARGFRCPHNLSGGLLAWCEAGLTAQRGSPDI